MNHHSNHNRDTLNEWLDAQVLGEAPSHITADQDLESLQSTAIWLQNRAHGGEQYAASTSPPVLKWENVMQAHFTTRNTPISSHTHTARKAPLTRTTLSETRIAQAVVRWQPAVSLAIVVAFLFSLMGIAYQRGILDQSTPNDSLPALGQAATPENVYQCVPYGPLRLSTTDLEHMNLGYWTAPEYTAARLATNEEGQAVVDAFVGWNQCVIYPSVMNGGRSPENLTSYYSDRWRYLSLAPTFVESRSEEIQAFRTRVNEVEEIVRNAPLPVGVPPTFGFDGARFVPQQVYQLTDGRFAVVFWGPFEGTLTMSSLLEPASQDESAYLEFMAFMEIDGKMYLDEQVVLPLSAIIDIFSAP